MYALCTIPFYNGLFCIAKQKRLPLRAFCSACISLKRHYIICMLCMYYIQHSFLYSSALIAQQKIEKASSLANILQCSFSYVHVHVLSFSVIYKYALYVQHFFCVQYICSTIEKATLASILQYSYNRCNVSYCYTVGPCGPLYDGGGWFGSEAHRALSQSKPTNDFWSLVQRRMGNRQKYATVPEETGPRELWRGVVWFVEWYYTSRHQDIKSR